MTREQNWVLSYGIAGAIILLTLILLGAVTLQLFAEEDEDADLSDKFIIKTCQKFIPVTSNYDGNRFITVQNYAWKESNILGRLHLCFSQLQLLNSVILHLLWILYLQFFV
ncbi:Uncharacterized membrane protein STKORF319 [Olea europaea subsp. europaea]|uniref:Uncharacterized membrane protein STKORF319 n=1 Tax=Olea europaea subsp. europaea TaxID=158383 RepID=A0A8S0TC03_OLEEU|nr:Uncharacterized membrane protein STKORF319 [Olea europaea subsp. europaea]